METFCHRGHIYAARCSFAPKPHIVPLFLKTPAVDATPAEPREKPDSILFTNFTAGLLERGSLC